MGWTDYPALFHITGNFVPCYMKTLRGDRTGFFLIGELPFFCSSVSGRTKAPSVSKRKFE
ncbi:hypothetical protein DW757_08460 [Clostridium sp. AM29-11AC]|nr:hypothetical protein CLOM621_06340 [Clostridium sp. M62/1]RHT56858.1 hypothetical protein DW757_08460 [Clostridium sp. AM29-11AC]